MLNLKKCDSCKSKKFTYEMSITILSLYLLGSGVYVTILLIKYLIAIF